MKTKLFFMTASLVFLAMSPHKISAQWVQSNFPTTNLVTDLKFYGNILYVATSGAGLFQTQNFTTWTPINNGLSTSNINEIITAIEGANITLYAATDAGVFRSAMLGFSWTPVNSGLSNLNVSTVFSDGEILYAGTQQGAFRSDNYGQSWTPLNIGAPSQVVDCFFKNGSDMLAGLHGPGEYLYRSTDNGLTWNPFGTGIYETNQLAKLDAELFAVSNTVMYHSLDNGAGWNLVESGLVPGMPILDIATGYNYLWIATIAGGFVQHTDSTNFRTITAGMPLGGTNLSAVAVSDEWIVYGSINNGVWYESIDVINGIEDPLPPCGVVTCFPNPTRGVISLQSLVFSQGPVVVEMVDLYGKIVETRNTGTQEPWNSGTLELNLCHLPAGIYFVRISLENQMIVKKIIKL